MAYRDSKTLKNNPPKTSTSISNSQSIFYNTLKQKSISSFNNLNILSTSTKNKDQSAFKKKNSVKKAVGKQNGRNKGTSKKQASKKLKNEINKVIESHHGKEAVRFMKEVKFLEMLEDQELPKFVDNEDNTKDRKQLQIQQYCFQKKIAEPEEILSLMPQFQNMENLKVVIQSKCKASQCLECTLMQQQQSQLLFPQKNFSSSFPLLLRYLPSFLSRTKSSCKFFISIYMENIANSSEIYDMLSIRRQIKKTPEELVKTYISNTRKSNLILKKLIEFAEHRQLLNNQEGIHGIIVIRIQVQEIETNSQVNATIQNVKYIELSKEREFSKQHHTQNSALIQIIRIYENCRKNHLSEFLKKPKIEHKNESRIDQNQQDQKKLLKYIDSLYNELENNKKELQVYKQKISQQKEESDEEADEDLVLPSERNTINLKKYQALNAKPKIFNLHPSMK